MAAKCTLKRAYLRIINNVNTTQAIFWFIYHLIFRTGLNYGCRNAHIKLYQFFLWFDIVNLAEVLVASSVPGDIFHHFLNISLYETVSYRE